MKYLTLVVALLFMGIELQAQGCLPSGVSLTSQSDIDNFEINNPSCSHIQGNVIIVSNSLSDPITDLSGLNGITHIDGFLLIANNASFSTISGFNALDSVGSQIIIRENQILSEITGFSNLRIANNLLTINRCPELSSISGFQNLEYVGSTLELWQTGIEQIENFISLREVSGSLFIYNNDSLSTVSQFDSLKTVQGAISIFNNSVVELINGFGHIDTIGGNLNIYSMASLGTLSVFDSLRHIGGSCFIGIMSDLVLIDDWSSLSTLGGLLNIIDLESINSLGFISTLTSITGLLSIRECDNLMSLSGLDNIDHTGITELRIKDNPLLSTCALQNICDYIESAGASTDISNNASGCSDEAEVQNECDTALPVELLSFTAHLKNKEVILSWETAFELNNEGFIIERSVDTRNWQEIEFMPGKGTSSEHSVYTYMDKAPHQGINYYRLKQIDYDGAIDHSFIVSITNDGSVSKPALSLYPNPAKDILHVEIPTLQPNVTVYIYNIWGEQVKTINYSEEQITINLSTLNPGTYLVSVQSINQQTLTKTFIKQ